MPLNCYGCSCYWFSSLLHPGVESFQLATAAPSVELCPYLSVHSTLTQTMFLQVHFLGHYKFFFSFIFMPG